MKRSPARSQVQAARLGCCPPCGKQTYSSRKAARSAARTSFPNEQLNAYRCPRNPDHWHFGHLSEQVRGGEQDREQYYHRPAVTP